MFDIEAEFQLHGNTFKLNKIKDKFEQIDVVFRLGEVLTKFMTMASELQKKGKKKELDAGEALESFTPIFTAISRLPKDDREAVIKSMLSHVEIKQDKGWALVAVRGQIMFDNLEVPTILMLTGREFLFNVMPFLALVPQVSHGTKASSAK